ncbi:RDD family protein [Luteimonas sp. SDU101]|uniref:RDD family protein n=1 Tax=Luteimonas sp. SDU101 TaxID=3422593 RepID=UPI003EC0D8F0
MSVAHAAPAGLSRRYAAWSLDMAPVLLVAALTSTHTLRNGATRIAEAFDALVQAMARAMLDLLAQGGSPLELSQAWLADPAQRALVTSLSEAIAGTLLPPLLLACVLALAWFAGWEASPAQATPGKRALGLRSCTASGGRIGLARAAARHLAGTLSWLTFNIGHLLALTPPRYQALHDRIAGTRVLRVDPAKGLPAWAAAWLVLQCLAAVAIAAWLFVGTQAAMHRALDAVLL